MTEVLDTADVELVAEYADVMQAGARNMQNYALLRRLASVPHPVLLKRSPCGTIKEWPLAAEYLLSAGNSRVILCERGIKTFETETRNTPFRSPPEKEPLVTFRVRIYFSQHCRRKALRGGVGPCGYVSPFGEGRAVIERQAAVVPQKNW